MGDHSGEDVGVGCEGHGISRIFFDLRIEKKLKNPTAKSYPRIAMEDKGLLIDTGLIPPSSLEQRGDLVYFPGDGRGDVEIFGLVQELFKQLWATHICAEDEDEVEDRVQADKSLQGVFEPGIEPAVDGFVDE